MTPIRFERSSDGSIATITLARPKANVLDSEMIEAITGQVKTLADDTGLRLLVFAAEGRHFSFGASVPEHLPGKVDKMLPAFHQMFREIESAGLPTAAVVRGQCLGGAAELATWCGMVFCEPRTHIGVPEIKLGVFPPIAAFALRWRVGGHNATKLVITGQSIAGEEAVRLGLADHCSDDPDAALQAWHDEHLASLSPAALRAAWRATRRPLAEALHTELDELERQYLSELMAHPDALEGLTAFLEKRSPQWTGVSAS